jgi:two-component system nitrogen regulation sensor histidine kinase NtrY
MPELVKMRTMMAVSLKSGSHSPYWMAGIWTEGICFFGCLTGYLVFDSEAGNRKLSTVERQDILESLRTIDQRSKSLKEFVGNFKTVNQIPDPAMAKIAIQDLINEVRQLFSKELEREKIELVVNAEDSLFVYADKNLTMQALINLMKNAMEAMIHMKEGKRLRLSVERNGHHFIRLHIVDNGCGIPAEEIEQIFVPFYSTKKGGSGIGLSIAHQIMQKQKGDLSAVSVPGKGSVFTASFIS